MNHAPPSLMTILAIALCALADADGSFAQGACPAVRLTAGDGATFDSFGYSVAVSGNTTLIAAQWDNDLGTESGSVYVLRRDGTTWVEVQKLLASDGQAGDDFGHSVAMNGDVALIGALHVHDDGAELAYGAAYVFRFNSLAWVEEKELLASDSAFQDGFGAAVSISGDVALIGAPLDDDNGSGSGSAYMFHFDPGTSQWIEDTKLTASDAAAADNFGGAVAISDDIAVIGAVGNDDACPGIPSCNSGAAYIFRYDAETSRWVEQQKLLASDGAGGDRFGASVSISGDVALVGARLDGAGSAYVFRFDPQTSAWDQEQKLLPSGGLPQQFGRAVAMDGDTAVIGSWLADGLDFDHGAAYVFRYDPAGAPGSQWTQQDILLPDPGPWTAFFGWSVAIDGDTTVIGAHGEDHQAGAAYVFDLAACLCPADLDGDGTVGILDLLTLLTAWGSDPGGPPDFDGDGTVGILDLLILLANWGPCP